MSLHEFYRKLSYRKKIFTGMTIVVLVSTMICLFGVLISFKAANEKRLTDEAKSILESSVDVFAAKSSDIQAATATIAQAPATTRMLVAGYTDDMHDVYRLLYSTNTKLGSYADFAVYDRSGILKLYTGKLDYIKRNLSVNWGILYEITQNPGSIIIRNARIYNGDDKTVFLRIGQAVTDEAGTVIGFVVADITSENFKEIFQSLNVSQSGTLYIMDGFEERVYASSTIDDYAFNDVRAKLACITDGKYLVSHDNVYRFYYLYDEADGLHVVFRQKVEPFNTMLRSLTFIVPMAALISLLLGLVISRNISSMFYRPIRRMSVGMEEIKKGNFEVKIKVDSDDELGRLSDNFNEMSEKLTDNMNELLDREKQLSDANIKMMQAQLNPHFIYNTLDTMKWIAKDNEIPEIATLSQGLADIMRASISSGQTVKLHKEIELVESYVEIQKIRFDDKFIFIADVDEAALECEVPKLILQPVVENAIIHGLKDRSFGQVLVQASIDEDKLIIYVRDDGQGMDEETMNKLNNHEQLAKGSNIGFHNVDSIIRLHYGNEYGLKVTTSSDKGTEIRYVLPVKIGN